MGRFINADVFASTGQGLVGNNMFTYCLNNPVNLVDLGGMISRKAGQLTDEEREFEEYYNNTFPIPYDFELDEYDDVKISKFETTIDERESLLTDLSMLEVSAVIGCICPVAGVVVGFISVLMNHKTCPQAGSYQCYCVTKTKHDLETGEIIDQKEEYFYKKPQEDSFYYYAVRWCNDGGFVAIH